MSDEDGGGNPSYAAYEYQIEVTAWIAVDLLLARRLCEKIEIEAKTKEDVEADIAHQFPTTGLDAGTSLTIQIKTKSTGAWSAAAFAKVLRGEFPRGDDGSVPAKGPPPRIRPLGMLRDEALRSYLFITDAAVDKSLFPFRVDTAGDPSSAVSLPSRSADILEEDEDAKTIAPRISIMASVSRELVRLRLEKLLRSHGHVPEQFVETCIYGLVEGIRDRMLARTAGVLSRVQLVELLRKYGGSVHSDANLDRYVEPKSLARIEQLLNSQHAVIITGPSGTGKTMTADYLEASLLKERGYEVIGAEDGPEGVRHALRSSGVYLFHLKDPFGKTRYLQAARPWASDLLNLLSEAGPDKKFLITTRSDVIHEAKVGTTDLGRKQLERYSIALEATDYSRAARAQIYDNHVSRLKGRDRQFAIASRTDALAQLLRPFEIDRFVLAVELSDGNRNLEKLIAESQVDAIARIVCDQITESEEKAKAIGSAAVLWALIAGSGAADRQLLRPIRRALRERDVKVDLDTFSELMVLGSNLRSRGDHLNFPHPQIAKGFALAMEADQDLTEEVLRALVNALVAMDERDGGSDWGAETGNKFRRQLIEDEIDIEPSIDRPIAHLLDTQLERSLKTEDAGRFSNRLRNIALLGTEDALSARFARSLTHEQRPDRRSKSNRHWGYFWSLADADRDMVATYAADDLCRFIARRFVADMLLETAISYRSGLAEYLHSVDPTLAEDALEVVCERVSDGSKSINNLGTAVSLALSSERPPVTRLIDFFLEIESKRNAQRDSELVRQASQNVLDEGYAEFVFDRVRDDLFVPSVGLQAVIKWVRKHMLATLYEHPRRQEFLNEWMAVCEERAENVSAEEIDVLFGISVDEDSRAGLWKIIGKSGHRKYVDRLSQEVLQDWKAGRELREARLVALSALTDDFATRIARIDAAKSMPCLLTILFDYSNVQAAFDNNEKAERERNIASLSKDLPSELLALRTMIENGDKVVRGRQTQSNDEIIEPGLTLLGSQLIRELPEDLQIALIAADHSITDVVDIASRLSRSPHAHVVAAAVNVLAKVDGGESSSLDELFWAGFRHDDYRVREASLGALVPRIGTSDRECLTKRAAEDESATVRLLFANKMQTTPWTEAIGALCVLLSDERNFDAYPSFEAKQTSYDVARSAATALGAFATLPESAIIALISKASIVSDDAKLGPALLDAMRTHDSSVVHDWLMEACNGNVSGLNQDDAYWELVTRSEGDTLPADKRFRDCLISASNSNHEEIAIPAVIAIALNPDQTLFETVWQSSTQNQSKIKSLMVFAAIVKGKPNVKSWVINQLNASLPADRLALILDRSERGEEGDHELDDAATAWLQSLDPDVFLDQRLRMILDRFFEGDTSETLASDAYSFDSDLDG